MRRTMLVAGGLLLASVSTAAHADSYATARAEIENHTARLLLAMDARNGDTYAAIFTPDGELIRGKDITRGRKNITDAIANPKDPVPDRCCAVRVPPDPTFRPRIETTLTNEAIKVDGDNATQIAYWTAITNATPQKNVAVFGFGHFEDHWVKHDGHWLLKSRQIFNESKPGEREVFYPDLGEKDPTAKAPQ